jgi:23S rRNA pseudouridine1911/1915/1917 synthase
VEGTIGRDPNDRLRFRVYEDPEKGKWAVTHWKVLERYGFVTVVECRLETGRTHQIRVQFSSRGFPLLGDRKYGADDGEEQIALWSFRLAFRHPRTGKPACFQLPPPPQGPWSRVRPAPDALETLIPSAEFGRIG